MNKFWPAILLTAAAFGLAAPAAQARTAPTFWQMSIGDLQRTYPAVAISTVKRQGAVAELRDVRVSGASWSRVVFHYDADGRLLRLQMWTRERSYEQLEAELADGDDAIWRLAGDDDRQAPAARALLCDYGAQGVALSFEQPARGLPRTQIASQGLKPASGASAAAALTE
jgi:hypothetical protein